MPDYSTKSYAEIASLLEEAGSKIGGQSVKAKAQELLRTGSFGAATVKNLTAQGMASHQEAKQGEFNQGTYATQIGRNYTSATNYQTNVGVGGASIGSGFCAGVVLDWIRKAVNSGWNLNGSQLTYRYAKIKAAEASNPGHKTVRTAQKDAFDSVGRMSQGWHHSSTNMTWNRPGGASASTPYRMKQSTWNAVADVLDGEPGTAGEEFKNVSLINSKRATYTSRQWWDALKGSNTSTMPIGAHQAAQINFKVGSTTGHAVAVWRRREVQDLPDSFYFFDPNFGMYSYSLTGLGKTLLMLFYKNDGHTPYYNSCASKDAQVMSYLVFGLASTATAMANPYTPPRHGLA